MKLVMFDIDGTLTQTNEADERCSVQALQQVFGFTDINTDWASYPHCSDSAILEVIFQTQLWRPPVTAEVVLGLQGHAREPVMIVARWSRPLRRSFVLSIHHALCVLAHHRSLTRGYAPCLGIGKADLLFTALVEVLVPRFMVPNDEHRPPQTLIKIGSPS